MDLELIQAYTALYTGSVTASKNQEFLKLYLNNFKNVDTLVEKISNLNGKEELELLQDTYSVLKNMKIKFDFEGLHRDHIKPKIKEQLQMEENLKEFGINFYDTDLTIKKLGENGLNIQYLSLEQIKPYKEHPIGALIYKILKNQREIKTYENLQKFQQNGFISPSFYLWGSLSGRVISYNPSLQNLPKYYKDYILPNNEGESIYELDIKSAEILGVAYLANEDKIFELIRNKIDIYKYIFSRLFNKEVKGVTSEQRDLTKKIVNGLNLGIGNISLAQLINESKLNKVDISEKQASSIKRRYFELFPKLEHYYQKVSKEEKLTTLLGFSMPVDMPYKNISFYSQNIIATTIKTVLASFINYKENIVNVVHDSIWISVKPDKLILFEDAFNEIISQLIPEEYRVDNLELIKVKKIGGRYYEAN